MVYHDIVRLNITVHDAHTVGIIQGLQQLIQVVADVIIRQVLI